MGQLETDAQSKVIIKHQPFGLCFFQNKDEALFTFSPSETSFSVTVKKFNYTFNASAILI